MPCRPAKSTARDCAREATATQRAPSTTAKSRTTFSAMRPGPTTPQRISSLTRATLSEAHGAGFLRRRPPMGAGGPHRQTAPVALLIDSSVWPWRGRRWSHLVSDVSYDELHAFVAAELGIPRRAFQGDHYDVPEDLYAVAVAAGAEPVGARELLGRLMAAGLRLKKPRHGA